MSDEQMNDSTFSRLFIIMIIAMAILGGLLMVLASFTAKDVNEQLDQQTITENSSKKAEQLKPYGSFSAQNSEKTTEPNTQTAVKSGDQVYASGCAACHTAGVAGAPTTGDKAEWTNRISKGIDTLYKNAINGIGAMPAKGGFSTLSDDEIKAAVDYMIEKSQ